MSPWEDEMNALFDALKKYILIYGLFLKNGLMAQMEYRVNFLTSIAMEGGYLCVKLSYAVVVYRSGVTIHGLSPDEILLFIGSFIALTGVYAGLYATSNFRLREKIKDGDLDLLISKPVSTQFMATLRHIDLTLFTLDMVAGLALVVIAWQRLRIPVTVVNIVGYAVFFVISSVVAYCVFLLPQILSFWLVNTSAIVEVSDSMWDINSMPMGIYPRWIQQFGVFALPVFFITNFPPLFVLNKMTPGYYAWAALAPIILLFIVRAFWNWGLRSYSSASS